MKRVIIVDHFSKAPGEPGNNRFIYLAELLFQKGFEVEVITTTFSHLKKRQRELPSIKLDQLPYKFTMLKEPGYPKNVCLSRFKSHFVFGKNLTKYLEKIQKPDVVLAAVPSLDVGTAIGDYCAKYNIPFIVDIQDLWPEAFKLVLKVPIVSDLIFLPMTIQANRFYKQADRIVAVSETYLNRGLKNNVKDTDGLCVYLGTDLGEFDKYKYSTSLQKRDDELWIGYAGTLGHSYNIDIVFEALNLLPDKFSNKVVFHIFGDGPYLQRFKETAKSCKIKSVFHGRLDYPTMVASLCQMDIAVNPIVKGAAQSIINKHADYAAAGLPVVNTQECKEYQDLLSTYQCGVNCDVQSAKQVSEALQELISNSELRTQMGLNSRKMAEEKFDRRYTYEKIVETVKDLVR